MAADLFYVIHLKGIVSNKTSGKVLKLGDQLNSNDQVKFGSSDAAAVIMGSKGKFTLTPVSSGNNTSELVAIVQNAILPLKSNGHLSTRGSESEAGISDLKSYFGNSIFTIIGDELSVKIDSKKYPLTEKQLFIYRYTYNGTVVSKKITHKENLIILNKADLYTFNESNIDPIKVENVDIYYYNTETKNSTKAASFSPIFINEQNLMEELLIQKDLLKKQNLSEEQIEKELLSSINDIYGKTDGKMFVKWLRNNVSSK
jgi:hypothetical protein